MMCIRLYLSICIALLVWSPANAQFSGKAGKGQPIEITADSLEVVQPNQQATFSGNVKAKQGNVVLSAAKMIVHYRAKEERSGEMGAVSKIEASGNVIMTTPTETAQGALGIYNVDSKTIWLMNNVVLTRGKNVLKGSRLEYSFASGKSLITSDKNTQGSGRVKAIFVPGAEEQP